MSKIDLTVAGYIISQNKALLIHHKKLDLWLPVGGHIEENETPDQALRREVKEEVGIEMDIIPQSDMPVSGNVKYNLATPFYVNVHSVGNHDHCCLFYVCKPKNPEKLKMNTSELKNLDWFGKEDLDKDCVPIDVKHQCLKAFEVYQQNS